MNKETEKLWLAWSKLGVELTGSIEWPGILDSIKSEITAHADNEIERIKSEARKLEAMLDDFNP